MTTLISSKHFRYPEFLQHIPPRSRRYRPPMEKYPGRGESVWERLSGAQQKGPVRKRLWVIVHSEDRARVRHRPGIQVMQKVK